jgi:phosphopantothenoylcysteine synthetase/decarboxylase
VGFKAETAKSANELKAAAERFMKESRVDIVVANDVSGGRVLGSGFSEVIILTKKKAVKVPRDVKENVARRILDVVAAEIR